MSIEAMNPGQSGQGTISVTAQAVKKAFEMMLKQSRTDLKLRVYIEGGGCSGFQYGFAFEDAIEDDDEVIVEDGVQVLVDPLSAQYLEGAQLDYKEDLQGSRFVLTNPNAKTTCGCGASFSI